MTNKITTIFFDAGGVLLDRPVHKEDSITFLLRSKGYPEDKIETAIAQGKSYLRINNQWLGTWEEEKNYFQGYYNAIASCLSEDPNLAKQLFFQTYYINYCALFPEVRGVLEALEGKYKLVIISNAYPSMEWVFDKLDISKYFHSLIISALVNCYKPQPEIYRISLEKADTKPDESIFIDDRKEHCKGAEDLGIRSFYLDRKVNDLKHILLDAGVEI